MLKFTTLTIAIGATMALLAFDANAMPVSSSLQIAAGSNVALVRDECGRGRHFSERLGHCVRDREFRRSECPRGMHFSERRGRCVDNFRARRSECDRGEHFSERRGRCVSNDRGEREQHRDNRNAAKAIGTILSIIGNGNHRNQHNNNQQNNNGQNNNGQNHKNGKGKHNKQQ